MPRGKTAKSLALIDACYSILEEIGYPLKAGHLVTSMI
jgi:hypothetical protein